jgi:rfaE bifunctional protein kinase chain/domain/rfaE bifunctional protein nucleotidyltransferase chain/domain
MTAIPLPQPMRSSWPGGQSRRRVVVVGDALLDRDVRGHVARLAPDAPVPVVDEREVITRPGGAALAAVLAARDNHDVTLVTALGRDEVGAELVRGLALLGVKILDLGSDGPTPEKIRVLAGEHLLLRLDRGARAGTPGALTDDAREVLSAADALLVSDYGRGLCERDDVRAWIARSVDRCPVVWDPHPRGAEPVPGAALVTPNRAEAALFANAPDVEDTDTSAHWCRRLLERWQAQAVVVKLGARGAVALELGGRPLYVPAPAVSSGDACGAGDRFAARVTGAVAEGVPLFRAVESAVASASVFVAGGGASSVVARAENDDAPPPPADDDALRVVDAVRAGGGRVVATGGCFDVLHAGHVRMLAAARALGDCLVVCLNSDASVKRLKGDARPIHDVNDRRAVLVALSSVDAVLMFDEDTPAEALRALRPDVWVKAADYAAPAARARGARDLRRGNRRRPLHRRPIDDPDRRGRAPPAGGPS